MTVSITVAVIAPSLLNTNGDAENAQVLARRARWGGAEAVVVPVEHPDDLPPDPDAIVIGSGSDADLEAARDLLLAIHDELRVAATRGVPILAVGTGLELLSWGIEHDDNTVTEGLGLVAGRAVANTARVSDDIVVASPRFGRLVGFENHARAYVGAEGSPLGRVAYGVGNGRDSSQEGVVMGEVIGTHLHGPLLAKNPAMADHLLASMFTRLGAGYVAGERAVEADKHAARARAAILERLGQTAD
ncbi:type 1 glutamine amidotransferase [Glaciibacter flavus]|uniref:type 1 glutamine amidotransferase n=1 Tax=Orlajensenia flava TaxID=2565934 RepID=UPI0014557846|nr:cobyric acid synthase [Glaciibacter flavus]